MPQFSLIIPCFNEAKGLAPLAARCEEIFAGQDIEIILVDNGSTDESPQILAQLIHGSALLRSVRVPVNFGYGHGILEGLRAANAPILGWTHADMQTDPKDVLRGLRLFQSSAVPQSLFVKGRRVARPPFDAFFTIGMAVFETALLHMPLWDINAQPTMFGRDFFRTWDNPPKDFSLDLYAYYTAKQKKLIVRRFPVHFGKRLHGLSRWNISPTAKMKFIKRTIGYSFTLAKSLKQP